MKYSTLLLRCFVSSVLCALWPFSHILVAGIIVMTRRSGVLSQGLQDVSVHL